MIVEYRFEEVQNLVFYVLDIDGASTQRSAHDLLGQATATLAKLVSCKTTSVLPLVRGASKSGNGELLVTSEEVNASRDKINVVLSAKKLDKKDVFGKSDPFLVFKRVRENGQWVAVHKTEVVMNTLDPKWKPISLPLQVLCNGDWNRPVGCPLLFVLSCPVLSVCLSFAFALSVRCVSC